MKIETLKMYMDLESEAHSWYVNKENQYHQIVEDITTTLINTTNNKIIHIIETDKAEDNFLALAKEFKVKIFLFWNVKTNHHIKEKLISNNQKRRK